MRKVTVELSGPALVVVLEVEAEARAIRVCGGVTEEIALETWIAMSEARTLIADAVRAERVSWIRREGTRRPTL